MSIFYFVKRESFVFTMICSLVQFGYRPSKAIHQKIGFIPGINIISDKKLLGKQGFPFVPKTFEIPADLEAAKTYAIENENALFFTKWNTHHGVRYIKPRDFYQVKNDSHIQEAVHPPLLIEGYKFDISCHVIITCLEPLRIYRNG